MAVELVARMDFGPHKTGDRITDPKVVEQVVRDHPAHFYIRVAPEKPDSKAPAKAPDAETLETTQKSG